MDGKQCKPCGVNGVITEADGHTTWEVRGDERVRVETYPVCAECREQIDHYPIAAADTEARVILDNGGGIVLQLGDWAHSYEDAAQCATDIREWLDSGTTDGWEGHEPECLEIEPTPDEIRNGGCRVIRLDRDTDTAASLADEIEAAWPGSRNAGDLAGALRA